MPKPRDHTAPRASRWFLVVVLGLVFVLGFTALSPLRQADFIQDDHPIVQRNPIVHRGDPLEIVSTGWWDGVGGSDASLYRPVTILSYALERGPGDRVLPSRGHTLNIFLHLLAAVALAALARRLGSGYVAAAFASLLFAVHPIHLAAVAPLVGRAEILATLFTLLALFCIRGEGPHLERWWPWGAGLCVLLGMASKESAAALPLLVILLDLLYHLPRSWVARGWWTERLRNVLPTVLAACAYLAARAVVLGRLFETQRVRMADNPLVTLDGIERIATAVGLAGRYLRLLLFPHPLSADYSGNVIPVERGFFAPLPLAGLIFLVLLLVVSLVPFAGRLLRRGDVGASEAAGEPVAPWAASALLFLLPYLVIGNLFVLVGIVFAERLIYLPSAGFCLLAGLAVGWLASRADRFRRPAAIACRLLLAAILAGVLLGATVHTRGESRNWMNEEAICEATIRAAPLSPRAHFTLAKIRLDQGRSDEALPLLEKTIELWPQFSAAWFEKGLILAERGRLEEAAAAFREASRLNPWRAESALNLALALRRLGRASDAEEELRRLLDEFPNMPKAHAELGHLLFDAGRYAEAAHAYDRAIALGREDLAVRSREAKRRALL